MMTRPPQTILVVDDDDHVRAAVVRILALQGFQTREASDVETALAKLDGISAVVSDFNLGDSDGLALLASISEQLPELPTVMLTADIDPRIRERALRQGVGAFLHKPVEAAQLVAALEEVCTKARRPSSRDREASSTSMGTPPEYDRDSGIFRGVRLPDLSETMSMIAHDIRSSLTTVLMAVDELQRHTELDARQVRLAKIAERNARQLEALARELAELGSAGSGRLELVRDPHDLSVLVGGIVADMSLRVGRALIVPHLQPGIRADVDPHRLGRAVTNVVDNALRFAVGLVVVTLEAQGDEACLVVEDDGPGIPPQLLPGLFQPFVRGSNAGTGLGLAITREIIRAHSGRVSAMNRKDGPGARFELRLPNALIANPHATETRASGPHP